MSTISYVTDFQTTLTALTKARPSYLAARHLFGDQTYPSAWSSDTEDFTALSSLVSSTQNNCFLWSFYLFAPL